jgi:uncharacterized cupin superfamily protein
LAASVNVISCKLDSELDVSGFRHRASALGPALGACRIGAGVYEADEHAWIWPYHYHHGIEEWLYVNSGAPVLRDLTGERTLSAGDFVCFPSGPSGTHTLKGPGRFVIFSTGHDRKPHISVYPDSDKVSGPEGILLRSSAVGYWHGEGTGAAPRAARPVNPPPRSDRQPVVNVDSLLPVLLADRERPPGFAVREAPLGAPLEARKLTATFYELDPGERSAPYHYEVGREEWLLVLSGSPALRHPDGEDVVGAGDVVCFVDGPDGAHQLVGRGSTPARFVVLSTTGLPATVHYPDSGKVLIREAETQWSIFRDADAVAYWQGEA